MHVNGRTEWTPQELAAQIAEIIREKPQAWNQESWFKAAEGQPVNTTDIRELLDDPEKPVCGTTACVAGWAAILTAPPGSMLSGAGLLLPDKTWRDAGEEGRKALGLSSRQASWLFGAYRTEDEVLKALDAIASGDGELVRTSSCECCNGD